MASRYYLDLAYACKHSSLDKQREYLEKAEQAEGEFNGYYLLK